MNKKLLITLLATSLLLPAKALAGQYGQYGGAGEARQVAIDKKVKHPSQTTKGDEPVWVENLFASDYKFQAEETVEFKLWITNTGSVDLEEVKVKDSLPSILKLDSGALEFTIDKLEPGQTYESETIKAKVIKAEEMPEGAGTYCQLNIAEVWADSQYDKDTSQVCVEKKVLGFKTIPEAGPGENLAILLSTIGFGSIGLALLKRQ